MTAFYKARIYDPETGRFLQPDPVHSENAGFDNWDRYQYANNNPVNFIDPTGESWLSGRLKNGRATGINYFFHNMNRGMKGIAHKFNGGLRGIAHKFNSSLKGITHNINNSVKTIGHKIDHAVKSPFAIAYYLFMDSGMDEEEIFLLILFMKGGTEETWFGHNYTGEAGNKDLFNDYYTKNEEFLKRLLIVRYILNDRMGTSISDSELMFFLLIVQFLSPRTVSFSDKLAQRHDREWPSNKNLKGIFDANNHYITGWFRGIGTKEFWKDPVDSIIVGGGGTVLFVTMNYFFLL
jgi:hypothetical protein